MQEEKGGVEHSLQGDRAQERKVLQGTLGTTLSGMGDSASERAGRQTGGRKEREAANAEWRKTTTMNDERDHVTTKQAKRDWSPTKAIWLTESGVSVGPRQGRGRRGDVQDVQGTSITVNNLV